MFTSFLKITLRNLYRERMYALINISGLSIAIACVLILGLYVRSEFTYDRHNVKHKQIFRVVNERNFDGWLDAHSATSWALGPMLAEDYPEIKAYVRISTKEVVLFRHGDDAFYWDDICYADKNIFDVFTHEIIYGDPKSALDDPTSIAVSETFAKKYFGDDNPIGETIRSEDSAYKITLVFSDLPDNSHLRYDALISFSKRIPSNAILGEGDLFTIGNSYTYLLMPENYDAREFKTISDTFFENHMAKIKNEFNGTTWRSWLQPLAETHFQTEVTDEHLPTGNRFYIYGFAFMALIILLVACINYMNLATARATKRSKEVGMRKILGAARRTLIFRFLGESIFFSFIALSLGLVLVEIILKLTPLNGLINKTLAFNLSREPGLLGWIIVFGILLGLLSGIYPAFYLSAIQPLSALVTGIRSGKAGVRFRQFLVLVQFTITIGVISSTLLMALQMRYVSQKSLGFHKENRLVIPLHGADLIEKMPIIRNELLQNTEILGMSIAETLQPLGIDGYGYFDFMDPAGVYNTDIQIENNIGALEEMTVKTMGVGDDFLGVMGIQLLAGRYFSDELLTDSGATYIVNETLVKKMGWSEPLGKRLGNGINTGRVIGVIKDFHYTSLHSPIEPLVICHQPALDTEFIPDDFRLYYHRPLILNISGNDIPGTLRFLEEKFDEFDPKRPFEFEFVDDLLNKLYVSEWRLMKLTGISACVCIFISCIGLIGLAAFTTEQHTKEIGIRKVLGSSTLQIIILLSRNILLLVLSGAVIASVAAYYVMINWLTGFAYHTGINPLVFALSSISAAAVAFITIALQSFKTAQANPVNALKYE